MNAEFNPYAPPKTTELSAPVAQNSDLPLASRRRRFAAFLVDRVVFSIFIVPAQYLTGTFQREIERQEAGGSPFAYPPEVVLWTAAALLFVVVINWSLLARGQTIGKLFLKLRIDRVVGGPCARGRIRMCARLPSTCARRSMRAWAHHH